MPLPKTASEIADALFSKLAQGFQEPQEPQQPQQPQQQQPTKLPDWLNSGNAVKGGIIGAAASAPFLGMIGEKKFVHDPRTNPHIPRTNSLEEIQRAAQPGDVVLTTRGGMNPYKTPQSLITGSDYFHAEPVVHNKGGIGHAITSASLYGTPKSTQEVMESAVPIGSGINIVDPEHPSALTGEDNLILMRPKTPLTPEQQAKYIEDFIPRTQTPYSSETAIGNWFKNVLVPKGNKVVHDPSCANAGDICSTAVSRSYEAATGNPVVPHKPTHETMPSDLLREGSAFEPVMYRFNTPEALEASKVVQKIHTPIAARAALGLGTAGLAYGATEHPEVAGGVAGGLASTNAMRKVMELAHREKMNRPAAYFKANSQLPSGWNMLDEIGMPKGKVAPAVGKFLTRTVPVAAAGAVGGYALTHKIHNMINNYRATHTDHANNG